MPEIIAMIRRLVELGAAYETGDGVYFSVSDDPDYGSLSRRNLDELRAGERIAVREEKRRPARLRAVEEGQTRRTDLG